MRVIPIAWTMIHAQNQLFEELGFDVNELIFEGQKDLDILGEFAGRNCYESFNKPNPKTASNENYLANILKTQHESVLEHSSVTFYADGISRNLLLELERHRHISFSVVSTRYVPADKFQSVVHPNTPDNLYYAVQQLDNVAHELAEFIYRTCTARGMSNKQSREVARQVLLGNTETRIVVTGNLRAWRYIVKLRYTEFADEEIRLFAGEVLRQLKEIAPNSVQDLEL
jgi:thymidylate synthase (FAD)